jgi:hypothetical protein
MKRRWIFSIVDDDREVFLNENGLAIDYSDAQEWIGDDREAAEECERRADLYEELTGGLVLKVKYRSWGRVLRNP